MNKFLILAVIVLHALNVNSAVKIKGELKNSSKVEYVYIYQYVVSHFIVRDSVKVKNDNFQFKYKDMLNGRYRIGLSEINAKDIIIGDEDFIIKADASNFTNTFEILNSNENKQFELFLSLQNEFINTSNEINMRARKISSTDVHRNKKIEELQIELNNAIAKRNNGFQIIISEAPKSFASTNANFILGIDQLEQSNFFNLYGDESLATSDVLSYSYNVYLAKYLAGKTEKTVKEELRELPNLKPEKSFSREVVFLSLIHWLKELDPNFAAKIASDYYMEYPKSPFKEAIKAELPVLPPDIGDYAPEIAMLNPDGKEMKLSETKGKLVLLDFWASWCGPCRRENPNVVKTYQEYKDKGFTVFSVSLDKQADRWKSAIEKDNLIWNTHVSDLRGWGSKAGKTYGVSSIPSTFLIDQNGVIIAKNLRGHQLEKKIKEILGE